MKVWIYCRSSLENQIAMQKKKCKEYAKEKEWEVVGTTEDKESGLIFNREALQGILKAAKQHKMDILLMQDISRLGRELRSTTEYIEQLNKYNVEVYTIDLGIIEPPAEKILEKVAAYREKRVNEFNKKYSI